MDTADEYFIPSEEDELAESEGDAHYWHERSAMDWRFGLPFRDPDAERSALWERQELKRRGEPYEPYQLHHLLEPPDDFEGLMHRVESGPPVLSADDLKVIRDFDFACFWRPTVTLAGQDRLAGIRGIPMTPELYAVAMLLWTQNRRWWERLRNLGTTPESLHEANTILRNGRPKAAGPTRAPMRVMLRPHRSVIHTRGGGRRTRRTVRRPSARSPGGGDSDGESEPPGLAAGGASHRRIARRSQTDRIRGWSIAVEQSTCSASQNVRAGRRWRDAEDLGEFTRVVPIPTDARFVLSGDVREVSVGRASVWGVRSESEQRTQRFDELAAVLDLIEEQGIVLVVPRLEGLAGRERAGSTVKAGRRGRRFAIARLPRRRRPRGSVSRPDTCLCDLRGAVGQSDAIAHGPSAIIDAPRHPGLVSLVGRQSTSGARRNLDDLYWRTVPTFRDCCNGLAAVGRCSHE